MRDEQKWTKDIRMKRLSSFLCWKQKQTTQYIQTIYSFILSLAKEKEKKYYKIMLS